LSVTAWIENNK